MAKYLGPRYKQCRRTGDAYDSRNERPHSSKCKSEKSPGQHGKAAGRTTSDYAAQLTMKQILKQKYGVLERQFRRYYELARKMEGATGENIIKLLESRLDNVVYRMGFASSRREARQLVSHRTILVDGKNVNIPSYRVNTGGKVAIAEHGKGQLRIQSACELSKEHIPSWIDVDSEHMSGVLNHLPSLDLLPPEYKNVNLVVEYYSK